MQTKPTSMITLVGVGALVLAIYRPLPALPGLTPVPPPNHYLDLPPLPIPDARDNLRLRTVSRHCEKLAIAAVQFYGLAACRLARNFRHCAGEHPRMAAFERFFAAGFKDKLIHLAADKRG